MKEELESRIPGGFIVAWFCSFPSFLPRLQNYKGDRGKPFLKPTSDQN